MTAYDLKRLSAEQLQKDLIIFRELTYKLVDIILQKGNKEQQSVMYASLLIAQSQAEDKTYKPTLRRDRIHVKRDAQD